MPIQRQKLTKVARFLNVGYRSRRKRRRVRLETILRRISSKWHQRFRFRETASTPTPQLLSSSNFGFVLHLLSVSVSSTTTKKKFRRRHICFYFRLIPETRTDRRTRATDGCTVNFASTLQGEKKSTREKHSSWTRRPFSAAIVVVVVVVVVIVAVAVVSSTCLSAPLSEKTEARARRSHRSEELPVRFIGHQNLGLKKRQNSKYSCSNFFVTVKKLSSAHLKKLTFSTI